MTVESNYAIAIATLSDWLKISHQFFNPREAKPKPIASCTRDFSRALNQLKVIAGNSDWFIPLFAIPSIGRSNYFSICFFRQ